MLIQILKKNGKEEKAKESAIDGNKYSLETIFLLSTIANYECIHYIKFNLVLSCILFGKYHVLIFLI